MIPYGYRKIINHGFADFNDIIWGDLWGTIKQTTMDNLYKASAVDVSFVDGMLHKFENVTDKLLPPWSDFYYETRHEQRDDAKKSIGEVDTSNITFGSLVHAEKSKEHEGWIYSITSFEMYSNTIMLPLIVYFFVDKNGKAISNPKDVNKDSIFQKALIPPILRESPKSALLLRDAATETTILSQFLSIMQCRNIKANLTHYPDFKPRKKQRHKIYKYYELMVVKPTVQNINQNHGIGIKGKALHTVRGHISHYEPNKPLFGISGLCGDFFIPQHIRGDIQWGRIEKDYALKLN